MNSLSRNKIDLSESMENVAIVSLIKQIVDRKWSFFGIFLCLFLLSSVVLFVKTRPQVEEIKKWSYTTYIAMPYIVVAGAPPLAETAAVIREVYAFKAGNLYPIEVEYEYETSGNLIRIVTKTNEEDKDKIISYHKALIAPFLTNDTIKSKSNSFVGSGIKSNYFSDQVLDIAIKRQNVVSVNKWKPSLILSISFSLSLVFAIFGVFLIDLISDVRNAIAKDRLKT
ncbi:hypothetical protein JWG44_16865 [Leptospira sp. 201903071]|uniref:hypothetical protein n=1 Tax=Leptospira ainazelensis TaxID=2810034 RepID=UPI001966C4A5|nr:hypothetical protein [Leptospira ainazelensis]MBM9501929.1 hypothetical protein [Leptospira ainazelensis]